jgi:leucyl-tRNA synthetase
VPDNIKNFESQLRRLGAMFDWSHQVNTTEPEYYRWTQWIFIQLYRAGLAYQKDAPVNWCPSCKTVLADEQAEGGYCERCNATVDIRSMRQWFFRITAYAQKLLDNLDWIDWSSATKNAQRRWIGRSSGAEVTFSVAGQDESIVVFTTRPDTIWGATYMVLAPEHSLVGGLTTPEQTSEVQAYIQAARVKTPIEREDLTTEKSGVFTGSYAINPANQERIPIWIADYVLMAYGTGAIMAVPAHDAHDFEFATRFGLPIVQVISPDGQIHEPSEAYVGDGKLVNSESFNGTSSQEAILKVTDWLVGKDSARHKVNYRLHDWCISRQRYWGPPIPMIHCEDCGVHPVPEDQLPVLLPFVEDFVPDGSGKSPLAGQGAFAKTTCPGCGRPARRETDVSDNFLDSAWFFFRYPSSDRGDVPFDRQLTEKWLPVNMYIGGNEHAVLHLMYTRFLTMALKDIGLIGFEEPFKCFRAHGMIIKDGAKMSKSKGNVINPDAFIERYGADTLRSYLMFLGPYREGGDFSDTGIIGIRRFIERLWRYVVETEFLDDPITDPALLSLLHKKTKKVSDDIAELRYNTAIAALMELLNGLLSQNHHRRQSAMTLLQLTAPFAPFVTHELWERLGNEGLISDAPWPSYDEELIREESGEFVIQINGKIRDRLQLPADASQPEVERVSFESARIQQLTEGKTILKTIFVPGKLLNIVVKG